MDKPYNYDRRVLVMNKQTEALKMAIEALKIFNGAIILDEVK